MSDGDRPFSPRAARANPGIQGEQSRCHIRRTDRKTLIFSEDRMVLVFTVGGITGMASLLPPARKRYPGLWRSAVVPASDLLAEVSSEGRHIPDLRRTDGPCNFPEEGVVLSDDGRPLNVIHSRQGTYLDPPGSLPDRLEGRYVFDVDQDRGGKHFVLHQSHEVDPSRKD